MRLFLGDYGIPPPQSRRLFLYSLLRFVRPKVGAGSVLKLEAPEVKWLCLEAFHRKLNARRAQYATLLRAIQRIQRAILRTHPRMREEVQSLRTAVEASSVSV